MDIRVLLDRDEVQNLSELRYYFEQIVRILHVLYLHNVRLQKVLAPRVLKDLRPLLGQVDALRVIEAVDNRINLNWQSGLNVIVSVKIQLVRVLCRVVELIRIFFQLLKHLLVMLELFERLLRFLRRHVKYRV